MVKNYQNFAQNILSTKECDFFGISGGGEIEQLVPQTYYEDHLGPALKKLESNKFEAAAVHCEFDI